MIRTVCIPTDGRRPRELARAAASFHATSSDRTGLGGLDLVVADNNPDAGDASAGVLRALAGERRVRFIGAWERAQYIPKLVEELGAGGAERTRALLTYALERSGSDGSNRNLLQLDQVGDLYASTDDDTISRACYLGTDADVGEPREHEGYDPTEFWFFNRRRDATGEGVFTHNPIGELDVALAEGGVAAVQTGIAGDAGIRGSSYLLRLQGPTRERLLANYSAARRGREVRRGVTRYTISSGHFFQTTCCAFDGRELLPPFLPLSRSCDALWGQTLRATHTNLIGHVPWAIVHDPPDERAPLLSSLDDAPASPAHLVGLVLREWPRSRSTNPATRMELLGAWLELWLARDPHVLEAEIAELRYAHLARSLAVFEAAVTNHAGPRPPEYSLDVGAARKAYHHRMRLRGSWSDLHPIGADGALSYLQAFARLLQLWPHVDAAARRLRAAGVRPALDVTPF